MVAFFMPLVAMAQNKNFLDVPYLETSARVEALVEPDRIYLGITISEGDTKGKTSLETQENKMVAELKKIGVDTDKDLVIKDLGSNFKKYFLRQKDVLKSRSYSLLVNSGLMASKALLALENAGIANVYVERTEYSEMESLKLELKSKAVLKAKEKAMAMTEPLGQKVGPAIHIVENAGVWNQRSQSGLNMMMEVNSVDDTPADLGFEKIRFEASVNVKFELSR